MLHLEIFLSFFKIGLFSFGGGYGAIPLITDEIVNQRGWITLNQLSDIIAISGLTPGPIGINSAIFIGDQVIGLSGSFVATLGFVIPSFIIVSALAYVYSKYRQIDVVQHAISGIRPTVVAIILGAGLTILLHALQLSSSGLNLIQSLIFIVAFYFAFIKKVSPIKIFIATLIFNVIIYFII